MVDVRPPKLRLAWGRTIGAAVIVSVFLFPVYWLFSTAFKTAAEIYSAPPVLFPSVFSLDSFRTILKDGDVIAIWNSLVVAGASTVAVMLLGTMAAYAIARQNTGGINLSVWILSQRTLPPILIVFPLFLIFASLGLVDSYLSLILVYTAFNLPYAIWMMRGYVEDVPRELEEAALVDGLSRWRVFLQVTLPMSRAGLLATGVFTFIFAWNEFLFALVLTRSEVITFPVQVSHYFGPQQILWAKVGAMSVLGCLPVFLTLAFAQRYLVRGMTMGAVKG